MQQKFKSFPSFIKWLNFCSALGKLSSSKKAFKEFILQFLPCPDCSIRKAKLPIFRPSNQWEPKKPQFNLVFSGISRFAHWSCFIKACKMHPWVSNRVPDERIFSYTWKHIILNIKFSGDRHCTQPLTPSLYFKPPPCFSFLRGITTRTSGLNHKLQYNHIIYVIHHFHSLLEITPLMTLRWVTFGF